MKVKTPEADTIEIGEFYPAPCDGTTTNFKYNVPVKTRVAIVILKEFGFNDFEHALYLDESNSTCQLSLPNLESGSYNAWIEVNGRTYIRQLRVENKSKGTWVGKIGRLFR